MTEEEKELQDRCPKTIKELVKLLKKFPQDASLKWECGAGISGHEGDLELQFNESLNTMSFKEEPINWGV